MGMRKSWEAETSGGESLATDYDVFLSFRGPDTRQGFTDCLYQGMLDVNIRVFFDEEELHVGKEIGDELPTAIEKSKIYIPIFSRNYASSAWCLRELAHMVECKNSKPSEKEIMPIFYDVAPGDVKLKSQLYIGALEEHEKKFGRQMRLKWVDALRSVPKIKGWELKKQGHGKFIKSVIGEILMKLKKREKLVTEHLVGMDDQVDAVVKLLDMDSRGVQFVLIHGMGGVGKTTLVKAVFNKLYFLFDHCCFLGNVREKSVGLDLVTLQKQLLSNMFGSGFSDGINDVDDWIKEIAERLSNRKLIIVLDDVDDEEQLENLAIKHISFGSGSRVILTTRDKRIAAGKALEYEVKQYEVKHLDPVQSLELFSKHAFGRNSPPDDYVDLSRQVVSTTGGLPLALEVIGSLLRRLDKDSWSDVLEQMRKIPPKKVQGKLMISYNALSDQQKQIFLDIACLFVDQDKTNAFYMWKDCDFYPNHSVEVLVCMSLIKITDDNKFWMHDLLRDLGRTIVCGEKALMDPRKQSRLWVSEMANDIIRSEEIKEAVEVICLDGNASRIYTSEEISRLPNIRFLKLTGGRLDGDFKKQLSMIRYMSWYGCPQELSATNFHPSNLVVLDLPYSSITEGWAGWCQIKVAKKLKVLDLTRCIHMTRTPDFSHYTSLERLILNDCSSLIEVDSSLERLQCLIYFSMNGCANLTELPQGIGRLQKLEYLHLRGCKKLRKLPQSFARVASLVRLDLSYTAFTELPDSIGNQKCLSVLNLQYTEIDKLPSSIGNLQQLKSLFLSSTKITELPQSIVELKELEELHADHCPHLKWEIPEGIGKLSVLRVLHLHSTPIRNVPTTIKLLPCLEKLELSGCSELKLLPELPASLITLSFGSRSLQWVSDLSNLTKLAKLSYDGHDENCYPLFFQDLIFQDGLCRQSLGFLPPSLSTLSLSYHKSVTSLSFCCNLRNLTCLGIYGCRWKEIQLDGLEQLIRFDVEGLEFLKEFAGLSSLKRLELFRLVKCPNLVAIQGLGSVESLEQLQIAECPKIKSLDDLSNLKKLKYLVIGACEELLAVKGLDELETLKGLEFRYCRSLGRLPNVLDWKVPDECSLRIIDCPNLEYSSFNGTFSLLRSLYSINPSFLIPSSSMRRSINR